MNGVHLRVRLVGRLSEAALAGAGTGCGKSPCSLADVLFLSIFAVFERPFR